MVWLTKDFGQDTYRLCIQPTGIYLIECARVIMNTLGIRRSALIINNILLGDDMTSGRERRRCIFVKQSVAGRLVRNTRILLATLTFQWS
jgi:hypothetical protein